MLNLHLSRGVFLIAFALLFGVTAWLRYPIGDFSRAGPGLFPVMISAILLVIGLATVVRSFFMRREALNLNLANIAIIIGSLCTFAVVSEFVNMILGIVLMVFIAALAGTHYSWMRNVKIAAVLVLFAFGFQKLLGLNLPLY